MLICLIANGIWLILLGMMTNGEKQAEPNPTRPCLPNDIDIPPFALALIYLLGVLQYWGIGLLLVNGLVGDVPDRAAFASYFIHWSSVGGLIGLAISRKGVRGSLIGVFVGLILSAVLMC